MGTPKLRLFVLLLLLHISSFSFSQDVRTNTADTTGESTNSPDEISIVSLDESDGNDANLTNVSTQANAYRDVFYNAARFNWSPVRFRKRGYNNDADKTYINGVPIENLGNGATPYYLWSGLSDIYKHSTNAPGLQMNNYGYGSYGGTYNLDARAFKQYKQLNVKYSVSNRNYTHRLSITKATGFNKKGWAFNFAGDRRFSDEGYITGTYQNAWAAQIGIDKKIDDQNIISFVAIYAPNETGRQGNVVQEMYDIAGTHNYNSLWGYQNGKKRNSAVNKTSQPIFIISQDLKINKKTSLTTGASYSFGKRRRGGVDWYNAPDPRPDYYRYLPSYYIDNPVLQEDVMGAMLEDVNLRQINFDKFFDVNRSHPETIYDINGKQLATGKRSLYILSDQVISSNNFNASSTLNTKFSKHIDFSSGLTYQYLRNNYYKEITDLLGGDFFVNVNQFAERDFRSNDSANINNLNNTNTIVKVGDTYDYNYVINSHKAAAWMQAMFKYKKLNFFLAGNGSATSFYRVGYYRTGLFPDNSFDKSSVNVFWNYGFKGGVSYKLNYRNYFYVNAAYQTNAPQFEKSYISIRRRNDVQSNLVSEKVTSVEGGYEYASPKFKFRATGYYTQFKDGIDQSTFYDDLSRTFANFSLTKIDKVNMGVEVGSDVLLVKGLTLNMAAAIGRYRYSNRPLLTATRDNSSDIILKDVVTYIKNYHTGSPEEAYSVGLYYRSKNYWGVGINANYFDQMWARISPVRRTYSAIEGVDYDSKLWHDILDQTKLPSQFTLNANANWSKKLKGSIFKGRKYTLLLINFNVNNILNNRDIVQTEYEQSRFDYLNKNPNKFPNKLSYAFGLNFGASVALRF
ncbi:TonB-dependent receptor [Ferruginibacter lapsinanis]|uniref:TonB-dependent receptor domain-containing protein n=1 Tax=Ferruginibacter lapsinanis TaxID=563172 RepID=UPI001E2E422C|nr:TonB-dependent receptor [Ferruginibacter lapsinanis]UEG48577.1 TonB-dependent receptor [Ferruginibacter lapsinanis]